MHVKHPRDHIHRYNPPLTFIFSGEPYDHFSYFTVTRLPSTPDSSFKKTPRSRSAMLRYGLRQKNAFSYLIENPSHGHVFMISNTRDEHTEIIGFVVICLQFQH